MESEEKSMENVDANVVKIGEKHFIEIEIDNEKIQIPMSDDNSNEVKKAFNKLIAKIEDKEFKVELKNIGEDLFSQVANEYIKQLNQDIHGVHDEMRRYGLLATLDKPQPN